MPGNPKSAPGETGTAAPAVPKRAGSPPRDSMPWRSRPPALGEAAGAAGPPPAGAAPSGSAEVPPWVGTTAVGTSASGVAAWPASGGPKRLGMPPSAGPMRAWIRVRSRPDSGRRVSGAAGEGGSLGVARGTSAGWASGAGGARKPCGTAS